MKQAFILLLFFTAFIADAQVQFWNPADIENELWEPFYKTQKLKQLTVHQTDEGGKMLNESAPKSISFYDTAGRKIASVRYKYNWNNKRNELLQADSLFYNGKGQLIRYSSYEGPEIVKVYETLLFYNARGQQVKQENYSRENYRMTKEGTGLFTYTTGNRPAKYTSKNTMPVLDHTRQFSYDKQGRLIRATFISGGGLNTDFSWNEKNQLSGYKEFNGKGLSKEVSFTYDESGRRASRHTVSTGGYFDHTIYYYKDKEQIPSFTYLTYPGYGGKTDMRHEYMQMIYQFY